MLAFTYSISVALMILAPIAIAVILRRRMQVPWFLFLVGSATFFGSQVVHIPLNNWLTELGVLSADIYEGELWRTALIMGLTAGLCEELARTVGYALLRRWRRFEHGLMMGIGHGGFEAMFFGGALTALTVGSLLSVQGMDLSELHLSPDQLAALNMQQNMFLSSPWLAFWPLLERLLAMTLHVICSMMVWRAFEKHNAGYVVLAIAYHALLDFGAVTARQYNWSVEAMEGAFALILVPGVIWLWWIRPKGEKARVHSVAPLRIEWRAFTVACRKEWMQLWRTRRVIVVGMVFLLFGFFSPLSAKFMPEIIKSMPGAEQFASLVPTPTVKDALEQYIKNLTQFGFILAVLLGMGAVAGEKEHGAAALILSKPLPRWAFVLSKFVAQAALYALGFVLSMAATYGYTLMLFGPVDLGSFLVCNLLLLLWLLVFVAITLLGSSLGGGTGAAAGIGFGGSVLVLLAGNLPYVGPVMPTILTALAAQIGFGVGDKAADMSGVGAVAGAFVLIALALIGALASFERQEL